MKPFTQQNYYELLEVSPDALPLEIRNAYKRALALYEGNAIASYSFFTEEEREAILERLEVAYLTLINADAKAAYDRLTKRVVLGERKATPDRARQPVALYDFRNTAGHVPSPTKRIDSPAR